MSSFTAELRAQLFIHSIIKDSYGQPLWPTYYVLDPVLGAGNLFSFETLQILSIFSYKSFVNIILLIFGCAGSLSLPLFSSMVSRGLLCSCRVWASHCCRAQALGLTGFRRCSTWAQKLWVPVSRAQVQWLWYTHLVGIFLDLRLNLRLLNWQAVSLPPSHQGSPGNLS